jgi:recombination protein RecT
MSNALDTLRAPAAAAPTNFPAMLKAYGTEIARALPKHMNGDRLSRIALTEFRKQPKLAQCDPKSVFAAVIMASQLGLEPGINGQCYLIPYKTECQFIPGWKGLVDLVNRTGRSTVWTGAVYDGDEFDWALGDRPFVTHRPCGEDDPKKITHVYAVGRVNGSEYPVIEVWPIRKIWKHRDRYNKVGDRHYSFRHPEMYARKVVLLQVIKYLPSSIEISQATDLEYAAQQGTQHLVNPLDVIEGSYFPVVDDPDAVPEPNPEPTPAAEAPTPEPAADLLPDAAPRKAK